MPDIILLAELADFYDVSIPEIIDGERKSENMNEEVKETVLKLSDYTETINQKIKGRLFVLTVRSVYKELHADHETAGKQGCDCVAWSRKRTCQPLPFLKEPLPR